MELVNKRYQIQGLDVLELSQKYGTPVYIYDAEIIQRQIENLKKSFEQVQLKIKYACKALNNISILKLFKFLGTGLDTVSIEEVQLGLKAGFEPSEIIYTPNCVDFNEIKQAVELGVVINIDNISILEQFGHEYKDTVPCCIRLNPHIMAGGNYKISTGHIDSKFGISILQIRHLQRIIKNDNIQVIGLHMHTGSDIVDIDVFLRGASILFEVAMEFPHLQFIDLGSGFKVRYKEDDLVTDVPLLGQKLSKVFQDFCSQYGRNLELWFEPGKYLVSECGILLTKVNVVKTTPATVFAGVNSGLNHLIRPMMYDAYHEIVNCTNTEGPTRLYTVVGYICETDTFGWDRKIDEIIETDILAIKNAGAYGFTMSSNYNARLRPPEVLIYKGKDYLIREREKIEDLLRNQIELDFYSL
ncbi:MAG: diaminopimelate decarboxylase [Bacteroidia bacterium]|nr:diaminopimelate decarboxylase [Bacteroidia bacterium]